MALFKQLYETYIFIFKQPLYLFLGYIFFIIVFFYDKRACIQILQDDMAKSKVKGQFQVQIFLFYLAFDQCIYIFKNRYKKIYTLETCAGL